jgi:hypothetical protein
MKDRNYITEADFERLRALVEGRWSAANSSGCEYLDRLEQELDRAEIVEAWAVPRDVTTMNSEVRLKDLDSGEACTYKLFPLRSVPTAASRYWRRSALRCRAIGPVMKSTGESSRVFDASTPRSPLHEASAAGGDEGRLLDATKAGTSAYYREPRISTMIGSCSRPEPRAGRGMGLL